MKNGIYKWQCHFFVASLIHMHVKIDQAGRIVLPKPVRDRMGLHKDSELELEETAEGIMLKPVEQEPLWRRENGRLVFIGRPVGKVNWDRIVDEDREARMRKIGGW
ncbi:MAG TPA: AbrB/MazE/SpoVT family DNA-binding domain-containing protein [Silvibacterium sp.]|nr:AbrB/MazE/SpoVT family DNA-binding domain-containing protein [Silvibacterium sp.]